MRIDVDNREKQLIHKYWYAASKAMQVQLLNTKRKTIDIEHAEPRNEKAEAVLIMETDTADANLVIFPPQFERVAMKYRDGRPRERVRADVVRSLLAE